MTGAAVRPEVLRRYHEASYGQHDAGNEAFEGADFDEYYLLMRIRFPGISRRRAAQSSGRREFLRLAARMPPDPPRGRGMLPRFCMIQREGLLDIAGAGIGPGIHNLALHGIGSISGWSGLRRFPRLDLLDLTLCGSEPEEPLLPPVPVGRVELVSCEPRCLAVALRSTSARELHISCDAPPPLSLALLQGHGGLEDLWIDAAILHRIDVLERLPLRRLYLSGVAADRTLRRMLQARAASLAELGLDCHEPFGPELLPELPSLRRLRVPGHAHFRAQWIEWAVAHPEVACQFVPGAVAAARPAIPRRATVPR